ncbi:MAG: vitamin K epoxide reductase family protein [Chloroflexota bacterium]
MFSHRFRFSILGTALVALFLLLTLAVQAQGIVVHGVFFYSPTCPHCHDVITNHWPGIQDEFGDQLQVLFIDVTTPAGSRLMGTAIDAMHIPSNGVPMLIIGTEVLVGSVDIPQRAPQVIREGLNSGGIGYPPIPGIASIFQSTLANPQPAQSEKGSFLDNPANLAAIIVLAGLIISIGVVGAAGWNLMIRRNRQHSNASRERLGRGLILIGALGGIGLAGSLLVGSFDNPITLLISLGVLAVFAILGFNLFSRRSPSLFSGWLIPLMIASGLLIAGYLTYVETSHIEATCGVIGDCNTVQQSVYAHILGIPVGMIGILGYVVMLFAWWLGKFRNLKQGNVVLFVITFLGVGFSIYLTVLEPFVIGASCVWCLTSAIIMTLILWLSSPIWDMGVQRLQPNSLKR